MFNKNSNNPFDLSLTSNALLAISCLLAFILLVIIVEFILQLYL